MGHWIQIGRIDQLDPGQGRALVVRDRRIALFNHDGEYRAIDDTCPHQGASLAEGTLMDGRVICPWHSWIFELDSGACPRNSHEPVQAYPTRRSGTNNDELEIQLPAE